MIDSRDKRSSVIMLGLPFRGMLPVPGVPDAGDRMHLAFLYRGIAAAITASTAICGAFITTLAISGAFATELAVQGTFATELAVNGAFDTGCPCEECD